MAVRVTQDVLEVVAGDTGNLRVTQIAIEVAVDVVIYIQPTAQAVAGCSAECVLTEVQNAVNFGAEADAGAQAEATLGIGIVVVAEAAVGASAEATLLILAPAVVDLTIEAIAGCSAQGELANLAPLYGEATVGCMISAGLLQVFAGKLYVVAIPVRLYGVPSPNMPVGYIKGASQYVGLAEEDVVDDERA